MANVTRGRGLLENPLARRRGRRALRLLPAELKGGALLDLGCGRIPLFLLGCGFAGRVGLDREVDAAAAAPADMRLLRFDLESGEKLPFADAAFAAAVMLAVIEHLPGAAAAVLVAEVHRVLRPGGAFVLTTPTAGAAGLLRLLARLRLLSAEEIGTHRVGYTPATLRRLLRGSGFGETAVRVGRFQLGLNLWALARKSHG